MINYIIRQQEANKTVTLRSISKRFQKPVAEVYTLLSQRWEGYDVVIHGPAEGATEVNVFEAGFAGSDAGIYAQAVPVEQPATEEAKPELTQCEGMDDLYVAEQEQTAKRTAKPADRRFVPGTYPDYTEETATERFPEGWLSVAEMHKFFLAQEIPVSRMVKAIGGDRMKWTPKNEVWTPFTIGGSSKRYLSRLALEEVEGMRSK